MVRLIKLIHENTLLVILLALISATWCTYRISQLPQDYVNLKVKTDSHLYYLLLIEINKDPEDNS